MKALLRRYWYLVCVLAVATVAYAGIIVHGQLVDASMENLSSDPASHTGRFYFNTSTNQPKIYNGSAWTGLGSGAGSGEKNYLSSGSSSATGWTASGAGVTCTTPTTNLPDPSLNTALGVTGVSGSTAFCYAAFTLDDADFNKKMKLAFDQFAVSGYAASDMRVDVCSCGSAFSGGACSSGTVAQGCGTNATRLALSTDSSSVSALPALTGTYRTTWDSPGSSQKYIQVQVGLNGTNTHQLNLANIVAGPGIVTQGAAVSGWTTFTPTGTWTSNVTYTGRWRRVGDSMDLDVTLTLSGAPTAADLQINLPSGYTINTSSLSGSGSAEAPPPVFGSASIKAGTQRYSGNVIYGSSNTAITVASGVVGSNSGIVDNTHPATFASGDVVSIRAMLPVNEWAGSGTVNVVQNDVEFAYNTSTSTTTSDTTSFGYGPSGAQIQAITATLDRRVRFRTPIQATDQLVVEVSSDQLKWAPLIGSALAGSDVIYSISAQGTNLYGIGKINIQNSTDVDIRFAQYSAPSTSSTYGAAGSSWAGNGYWRVKKFSGGQAVGFGAANTTASGLVSYEDAGTLSATFTGPCSSGAQTIRYSRVGKNACLMVPNFTCTSSSATTFAAGAATVPSALRPSTLQVNTSAGIVTSGASSTTPGSLRVTTSGDIQIYATLPGGNFSSSSSVGLNQDVSVCYTVN